jgi:urease accessory protein
VTASVVPQASMTRRDDDAALATPTNAANAVRWPAHLRLRAERRGERSVPASGHEGPLRLLKTLHPEGPGVAHAVLVHPPGGLVGGDRLDIDVDVAAGAHLLVTNPAATRFYRSAGLEAAQCLRAHVAGGARLEWLPQETLAYDGCLALNRWHVRLDEGAALMAMEVLALGLAASAQPFTRGRFVQHLQIEGLWRERGVIDAADAALLDGPCGLAGHRVLGTLVLAEGSTIDPARMDAALEVARSEVAAVQNVQNAPFVLAGATGLQQRVLAVRVLADETEPALRLLRRVWARWRQACWGLAASEPRIWAS